VKVYLQLAFDNLLDCFY